MNGSYVHEQAIDEIDSAFCLRGIKTARQVMVEDNGHRGFIDLVAFASHGPIALEIERTPQRIARDLSKAMKLGAEKLWIVATNHRVAVRVRRQLELMQVRENEFLSVFTIPQALNEVTRID